MWLVAVIVLVAVWMVAAWMLYQRWPHPEETRFYRRANDSVKTEQQMAQSHSSMVGSPIANDLNAADGDGQRDVEALHELVTQYLQALQRRQGPPIGDDVDLAKALTGNNPFKRAVIPKNHPALSPDGHLRDRWGTPYHVHARSSTGYDIRSAGPDRKLFTEDDLVAPKQSGGL